MALVEIHEMTTQGNVLRRARWQRGFSLLEVLVTLVLTSFALLGLVGLQLSAVKYQKTAHLRIGAVEVAQSIADRIRANPSGAANGAYVRELAYGAALPTVLPAISCGSNATPCTNAAGAADRDIAEWVTTVANALPGGRAGIFRVAGEGANSPNRIVTVMWTERATTESDEAEVIDATCPAPQIAGVRCFNLLVSG
jgi:type IV pilus assembly protein PilV